MWEVLDRCRGSKRYREWIIQRSSPHAGGVIVGNEESHAKSFRHCIEDFEEVI
jgi:hypothetical protein